MSAANLNALIDGAFMGAVVMLLWIIRTRLDAILHELKRKQ